MDNKIQITSVRPISDTLATNLNKLINTLTKASFWHARMASQCRLQDVRGWGRWHDCESDTASDTILCLNKILVDKLRFVPTLDFTQFNQTQQHLGDIEQFKSHFTTWELLKQELIDTTNAVIQEIATVDMQLYKKMCCLAEKLQDDKTRVRMCKARLDKGNGSHDMMIVSMIIHKYFEHEHKSGDCYNINLG